MENLLTVGKLKELLKEYPDDMVMLDFDVVFEEWYIPETIKKITRGMPINNPEIIEKYPYIGNIITYKRKKYAEITGLAFDYNDEDNSKWKR